jgi:hypothetical protein
MNSGAAIKVLFWFAGLYDAALGLVFLLAPAGVFAWFGVVPPNHYGYVRFPAALLVIFGLMFFAVALDPVRNRNLIPFGIMLKLAYCGVVFGYWATSGLPTLWKPFALFDAVFALLFLQAWRMLEEGAA